MHTLPEMNPSFSKSNIMSNTRQILVLLKDFNF